MNTVEGLGSLQGRGEQRRPRFAKELDVQSSQQPGLRPAAQGTNRYAGVPTAPDDRRLGQLAESLGVGANFLQQREADNEREWMARKPALMQQIREDRGNGYISAVQVGEMFPEMVPSMRWRIAEALGRDWGRTKAQEIALEIEGNERLQYDSEARAEYIEQRRQEFFKEAGGENDFWHGGAMNTFGRAMDTWDQRWMERTSNYHKQLNMSQFKDEVLDNFYAFGPQGLLDLDAEWKESGPLHHSTRNQLVVETLIEAAAEQGAPEVLDMIPDRFLNRDTKAMLQDAKSNIARAELQQMRDAVWIEETSRKREQRDMQVGWMQRVIEDPTDTPSRSELVHHPELIPFAESLSEGLMINKNQSRELSRNIRRQILMSATTGDMRHIGLHSELFNEEALLEYVANNPRLRPEDRMSLMNEMDSLMEGITIMRDPDVMRVYDTQVAQSINNLLSDRNINERLARRGLGGGSLNAQATALYHAEAQAAVLRFMDHEGRWPNGFEKYPLLQEAVNKTMDWVQREASGRPTPGSPPNSSPEETGGTGTSDTQRTPRNQGQGPPRRAPF